MEPVGASAAEAESRKIRLEAWSWIGAFAAVFGVLVFAWGIGFPLRRILEGRTSVWTWTAVGSGILAGGSFLALSARRIVEFFLSIRVGIAVLVFFALGSVASVLVHPRDPDRYLDRGPEDQERMHREDFAWATGYFLYHLSRPYGIGMPRFEVPSEAEKGLRRIAAQYGARVANQERSGMRTALNGQVRGDEIRDFIARNRTSLDRAYNVCRFLQLNGTRSGKGAWTSDWFTALMILLFAVVLTNTFRRGIARAVAQGDPGTFGFLPALPAALLWDLRSLFSLQRIGFLVTHLGVLTSLAGGLLSKATEERGVVKLSVDPVRELIPRESYRFQLYSGGVRTFDPTFAVRLAAFRADYRDNLEIQFLDSPSKARTIPRYRFFEAWKGRSIGLEFDENGEGNPKTIVRVLDHYPRADVRLELEERGPQESPRHALEAAGPALRVGFAMGAEGRLVDAGGAYLFPGDTELSQLYDLPGIRIRLETVANEEAQSERLAASFEGEALGRLGVVVGDDAVTPAVSGDIAVGREFAFDTPQGQATIKILRALPDARLSPSAAGSLEPQFANLSPEDVPPLHPGIQCLVTPPRGREGTAWFYENPRDAIGGADGAIHVGGARVRVFLLWDRWRSPARVRYRLVTGPGLPLKFVKVGTSSAEEIRIGQAIPLDGGTLLRVEARADRPKLVPVVTPVAGDRDADKVFFDTSRPPAARIEVEGPEGRAEFTLAATELADEAVYGGRLKLRFFENTFELPREWKSKLEFLEPDAEGKEWVVKSTQTIRVNDYAKYRGYRFFQTDANHQLPGYSGVGVVKDDGIELVLVGLYAVVFGVAYVFLVKPLVLRWRPA